MSGKIPDDVKPFYERFNTETPTSPEEEAAKAAEGDEGGKKGKKKEKDKKAKKGKGKKAKGGGDGDDKPATFKLGTSEVITKFDEFYDEWKVDWD